MKENQIFPFNIKCAFKGRWQCLLQNNKYFVNIKLPWTQTLFFNMVMMLWATVFTADMAQVVFRTTVMLLRSHWKCLWSLCGQGPWHTEELAPTKGDWCVTSHRLTSFVKSCTWTHCKNYTQHPSGRQHACAFCTCVRKEVVSLGF